MKVSRTYMTASAVSVLALVGGCQLGPDAPSERVITLHHASSATERAEPLGETVELGAGDELGQAMFQQYLHVVRSEQQQGHDGSALVQSDAR